MQFQTLHRLFFFFNSSFPSLPPVRLEKRERERITNVTHTKTRIRRLCSKSSFNFHGRNYWKYPKYVRSLFPASGKLFAMKRMAKLLNWIEWNIIGNNNGIMAMKNVTKRQIVFVSSIDSDIVFPTLHKPFPLRNHFNC